MSLNCGAVCVKILLCTFNFLLFIAGGALLTVSIWAAVDISSFLLFTTITDNTNQIQSNNEVSLLETGAYILIVVGALLFFLGFLGCCGAILESKALLATYGVLIILVFLLEITAGILVAVFKDDVEKHLESIMENSLRNQYTTKDKADGNTFTWNAVMTKLECCGVHNYTDFDYAEKWQENLNFTDEFGQLLDDRIKVPRACCIPYRGSSEVDGVLMESMNSDSDQILDEKCLFNPAENNSYYQTGCHGRLKDWMNKHCDILMGATGAVGVLELILIILSFCLCSSLRDKSK